MGFAGYDFQYNDGEYCGFCIVGAASRADSGVERLVDRRGGPGRVRLLAPKKFSTVPLSRPRAGGRSFRRQPTVAVS